MIRHDVVGLTMVSPCPDCSHPVAAHKRLPAGQIVCTPCDDEWVALIQGDQPPEADQLRATRAVLMDRITAIDDLLAKLEPPPDPPTRLDPLEPANW